MAESIRFHLDEHIETAIARALRRVSIDVTTAREANILTAPDEAHWAFAQQESRVIVTCDRDFLRIKTVRPVHVGNRLHIVRYCPDVRDRTGSVDWLG